MSQERRPRGGFSLIELLVAVAVVAILAAVLLPTLSGIQARARMAHDGSNLREIGKAVALYLADHRNHLPHNVNRAGRFQAGEVVVTSQGRRQRIPIYESIDRYFPERRVGGSSTNNYLFRPVWFSRNAQPVRRGRTLGSESPTAVNRNNPYGNYAHFAFNPFIWSSSSRGGGRTGGPWRANMNLVPSPSHTVLLAETNNRFGIGDADFDPDRAPTEAADVGTFYRTSQPGRRGLYLFCDFSVRALTGDQGLTANPEIWKWW